jgi:hypothetical protein
MRTSDAAFGQSHEVIETHLKLRNEPKNQDELLPDSPGLRTNN